MKTRDIALALIVVLVWGVNFTVIKLGVSGVPPMLLVAIRFTLASLPAIAFVKKPKISWKYIIAYGATVGIGQFSCLFYSIHIGMPAGISSVVLQSAAFFTLLFAAVFLKESLKISQITGLIVAGMGLILIGANLGSSGLTSIPVNAFFLTILAAAFWGISNIVAKAASKEAELKGEKLDMLGLVIWSSLIPPIPMLLIAFLIDTPQTIWTALKGLTLVSVFSILYLAFFATLIGYGIWSTLLSKYPAGKVAPLSLLVPVIGLITAQIILKEKLSPIQWVGGCIILTGIIIANFGGAAYQAVLKKKGQNLEQ